MQGTASATDEVRSAWRGRLVAYGVLVVIALVALTGREAWPLSSFALFSGVRTGEQVTLQVVAVDREGRSHEVPLGRPGHPGRGAAQMVHLMSRKPVREQVAEVDAWMTTAGLEPSRMRSVCVYRTVRRVPTDGHRGPILRRRCTLVVHLGRRGS